MGKIFFKCMEEVVACSVAVKNLPTKYQLSLTEDGLALDATELVYKILKMETQAGVKD